MITEDYVSFETAKLLKEKGFDETLNSFYIKGVRGKYYLDRLSDACSKNSLLINGYTAPTLQMARKWLREKHHIHANPILQGRYDDPVENYSWCVSRGGVIYRNHTVSETLSYEQACEAAIKYCLTKLI